MDGNAISLVTADEYDQLQDIERLIQQHIEREVLDGFVPQNGLKESRPLLPPKRTKPKKPKKPREHAQGESSASARPDGKKPAGDKPQNRRPRRRKPAQGGGASASAGQKSGNASGTAPSKPASRPRRSQRPKRSPQ